MFQAVLFDLDGTLLDTEKYFRRCWPEAARQCGCEMTDEQALTLRSLGRPFAVEYIETMLGGKVAYHTVREARKGLMRRMMETEGVQAKPGAETLLRWLRQRGVTVAVVTASAPDYAEKYLGQVGLLPYFDRILSATMVQRGKPAPDVYAFACGQLGLSPADCLAVEDSPNGIRSAHDAGCAVVMVPDQTPATPDLLPLLWHQTDRLDGIIGLLLQQADD